MGDSACISARQFIRALANHLRDSPLAQRMAHGAFWSLSGALLSRAVSLISSILVARMLGKEGYGQLGMIQSTLGMFQIFAGFGLGLTATKYVAELRFSDRNKAGRVISLSIAFAAGAGTLMVVLLLFTSSWVAVKALASPAMSGLLQMGAPMLLCGAVAGAQTGALAGFEAFKSMARVNLIVAVVTFFFLVGGVYFMGLNGAVLGLLAANLIWVILNHLALSFEASRANIPFPAKDFFSERKILWNFSVPSVLASLLVTPVYWSASAILVNQPGGYADMGIFNAANQWRGAILFLPGILCQVGLPMLCSINKSEGNSEEVRKVFRYNLLINGSITLFAALLISIFSLQIMGIYGNSFGAGYVVLIMLAVSTFFVSINNVIGQTIVSSGKMWVGLGFNAIWAISLLGISIILVPLYRAEGLAAAYLAAFLIHTTVQGIYASRKLSVQYNGN